MNGTKSYDPEGQAITYRWVQSGGTRVSLSAATVTRPTFTAPTVATGQSITLSFELTVTDSRSLSTADTCLVQVTGAQASDSDGDGIPDDRDAYPNDASRWERNQAPLQPAITYPADGASAVGLTPVLYASAFSDANAGDTHSKSQWRIISRKTQKTVLQVTRSQYYLTDYRVPLLVLNKNTEYACQVRYFDNHGSASEWSPASTFTTRSATFARSSSLPDTPIDVGAMDLNANGLADAEEDEAMRCTAAYDGQHALAVSTEETSAEVVSIDDLVSVDPNTAEPLPPVRDLESYGLISFRIQVPQAGQEASVRLYFSEPIDPQAIWIEQSENGEWQKGDGRIRPDADGASVVRLLQDGGQNDVDGVANGIIIDMVAPRKAAADVSQDAGADEALASNTGGSHSSTAGSCFIGTLLK